MLYFLKHHTHTRSCAPMHAHAHTHTHTISSIRIALRLTSNFFIFSKQKKSNNFSINRIYECPSDFYWHFSQDILSFWPKKALRFASWHKLTNIEIKKGWTIYMLLSGDWLHLLYLIIHCIKSTPSSKNASCIVTDEQCRSLNYVSRWQNSLNKS